MAVLGRVAEQVGLGLAAAAAGLGLGGAAAPGPEDVLFGKIREWEESAQREEMKEDQEEQGGEGGVEDVIQWGRVLDAGTGAHSLRWLARLPTQQWTAVTADPTTAAQLRNDPFIPRRESHGDEILVGNWMEPDLLRGELYDVLLVDYLMGSVDGIAPFTQDLILPRLAQHMKPGGRMYIIGMQPIPETAPPPADLIVEMTKVRDACILLAGHRTYREYPLSWMQRHLEYSGFRVTQSHSFSILHSAASTTKQLDVARSKLPLFDDAQLADSMRARLNRLERKIAAAVAKQDKRRIACSYDYVLAARFLGLDASTRGIMLRGAASTGVVPCPGTHGVTKPSVNEANNSEEGIVKADRDLLRPAFLYPQRTANPEQRNTILDTAGLDSAVLPLAPAAAAPAAAAAAAAAAATAAKVPAAEEKTGDSDVATDASVDVDADANAAAVAASAVTVSIVAPQPSTTTTASAPSS